MSPAPPPEAMDPAGAGAALPPPRKRPRKGSSSASASAASPEAEGSDKKRSRGRPKLDLKDDESAADRRRTQIRLAQRAYRSRKENAISALERRVRELQDANDGMSSAFRELHDFALAQGLLEGAPEFGRQLRATTEKFLSLARTTARTTTTTTTGMEDGEGEEDGTAEGKEAADAEAEAVLAAGAGGILDRHPSHSGSEATPQGSERGSFGQEVSPASKVYLPCGYTVSDGRDEGMQLAQMTADSLPPPIDAPPPGYGGSHPAGASGNPNFPFAYPRMPRSKTNASGYFLNPSPPSPSPYASMPVPASYAASETTLSRRLQRTAIERGLRLISMPNPPPARLSRVFGFCLLFETRDMIIERMSRLARGGGQDSLHNWGYPFAYLGGAGTRTSEFAASLSLSGTTDYSSSSGSSPGPPEAAAAAATAGIYQQQQPYSMDGTGGERFKMLPLGCRMSMGPHDERVVGAQDAQLTDDMRIMLPGLEGEFFDAEETELYLRRKGIYVPVGLDEVVVEIDEASFREVRDGTGAGGGGSATVGGSQVPVAQVGGGNEAAFHSQAGHGVFDNATAVSNTPFTGASSGAMDPMTSAPGFSAMFSIPVSAPPGNMWQRPSGFTEFPVTAPGEYTLTDSIGGGQSTYQGHPAPPSSRKIVTLDVPTFISQLSSTAVCLGRASGFRKENIDAAVLAAIREV
ncbi:uncharacterized protein E0L32_005229 [Thyridium curvatum]|uniref:BZIP domain-containing protein n=1 Tax=Thyridium curvatum TaxID=1093900 RepID=A0A507B466_9PEZI|nr:uncharacterized protein E0L32_005229 [Thyridium curvatum]TPX14537.1 hypothetical protein E0L32_005229 [Thyridium curvatum]